MQDDAELVFNGKRFTGWTATLMVSAFLSTFVIVGFIAGVIAAGGHH